MAGAVKQQQSSRLMMEYNNVAGGRLAQFSTDPPTGYHRDGYCRVTSEDSANHSVAATVTSSFLDFTVSKGNNLVSAANVKPGMKWCLCASRWKEAYDAFKNGDLDKDAVPKVHLHASDKKALDVVSYKSLKEFKADGEATAQKGRQDVHIDPSARGGKSVKEGEMSGKRPTKDQQY